MKQHKVHRFVDSYIKCIGLIRDPSGRGSIIEFSALHGLLDGDQIYLEVQWDEPMLKVTKGRPGSFYLEKMYINCIKIEQKTSLNL